MAIRYEKKTALLVTEDDLLVDLAYHNVPPSLLIKFSERIVQPYYNGNLTAAIQDLLQKALTEREPIHVHITHTPYCNQTIPDGKLITASLF